MFEWLRQKVKAAVLAGINDAVKVIAVPVEIEAEVLELPCHEEPKPKPKGAR